MNCPICGTKMWPVVNHDIYTCHSCRLAWTGIALRNGQREKSIRKEIKKAAELFDELKTEAEKE
jgi:ribosomal protein L37AE/L43A